MLHLPPHECRVLGVLVEKALTTPTQYPLTLNALTSGCNQKNNRLPVMNLVEDQVLAAIDRLRAKQLVREVMLSGSRVAKYRHNTREVLDVTTSELVVLTELLLRGPQTLGELRTRASRMHALESLEVVEAILTGLAGREQPLVRRAPPAPGSRAQRHAQLLCPDLHPLDVAASASGSTSTASGAAPAASAPTSDLVARVERLEHEVDEMRKAMERLAVALGEQTPFDTAS